MVIVSLKNNYFIHIMDFNVFSILTDVCIRYIIFGGSIYEKYPSRDNQICCFSHFSIFNVCFRKVYVIVVYVVV